MGLFVIEFFLTRLEELEFCFVSVKRELSLMVCLQQNLQGGRGRVFYRRLDIYIFLM